LSVVHASRPPRRSTPSALATRLLPSARRLSLLLLPITARADHVYHLYQLPATPDSLQREHDESGNRPTHTAGREHTRLSPAFAGSTQSRSSLVPNSFLHPTFDVLIFDITFFLLGLDPRRHRLAGCSSCDHSHRRHNADTKKGFYRERPSFLIFDCYRIRDDRQRLVRNRSYLVISIRRSTQSSTTTNISLGLEQITEDQHPYDGRGSQVSGECCSPSSSCRSQSTLTRLTRSCARLPSPVLSMSEGI